MIVIVKNYIKNTFSMAFIDFLTITMRHFNFLYL